MNIHLAKLATVAGLASMMGCNGIDERGAVGDDTTEEEIAEEVGTAEQDLCLYPPVRPTAFDDTGTLTYAMGYEELIGSQTSTCDRYITSIDVETTVHTLRIASNGVFPCQPDYNIRAWARNNSTWTELSLTKGYRGGNPPWDPVCYVEATYTFGPLNGYDEIVTAAYVEGNPGISVYVERY